MRIVGVAVAVILGACAHTQPNNASKLEAWASCQTGTNTFCQQYKKAKVTASCQYDRCKVFVNETLAEELVSYASFIQEVKGALGLFLLSFYEGDSCPVQYKLLQVNEDGSYSSTDNFGNCEGAEITYSTEGVSFFFAGFEYKDDDTEIKRLEERHLYSFVTRTLK